MLLVFFFRFSLSTKAKEEKSIQNDSGKKEVKNNTQNKQILKYARETEKLAHEIRLSYMIFSL